jgi:hypothetical protein
MISLVKESKLVPSKVIEQAVAFFGPAGWAGLKVLDRADCYARFEGGGGQVLVEATGREDSWGSEVRVESRAWDHVTQVFLEEL